jgi:hypothetical protein
LSRPQKQKGQPNSSPCASIHFGGASFSQYENLVKRSRLPGKRLLRLLASPADYG